MKSYLTKVLTVLTILVGLSVTSLFADVTVDDASVKKELKEKLPYLMKSNNAGTLFYLTFHPTLEEGVAAGSGIRIYVSSAVATTVTLEIKGLGIVRQRTTIPNDVIEFFLAPAEAQMYHKVYEAARPEQVWAGRAIRISANDPIICYGVARFRATSDGYLALPASSLSNNYQVASSPNAFSGWGYELPSYTSIVGIYDDTRVTFRMGGCETCYALKNDGTYLSMNQTIRRTLNEGDVWLIPGIGPYSDLTGSTIKANKPVNVISGNQCAQIPTHIRACDHIVEQEMPENMWGTKLHVTPIVTRKNFSVVKIFAKKPNTRIYADGIPSWFVVTPGGITGSGFIETRAGTMAPGQQWPHPVEISGDDAINVVQYNPGAQDDNQTDNDPFQISLTPIEQYQNEIVFNTPGIRGQYGFKDNYINLVYLATVDGQIPEDLEWAEVVDGNFRWIPMAAYSGNPGSRFLTTEPNGRHYRSKTLKLPYDGVYRVRANDPFACYAYGYDWYDSYGWPTSVATADLETPDSLAPYVEFGKDCGGDVNGVVIDEPRIDPENRSNLGLVYMATDNSYNYRFTFDPFIAGQDARTNWRLRIGNAALNAQAHLVFMDRVGNRKDTIIRHFALSPNLFPYHSDYGTFKIENPNLEKTVTFTVKNEGDNPIPGNYDIFVVLDSDLEEDKSGDIRTYQNFDLIDIKGVNLSPMAVGQERRFDVKFTARAEGTFRDSIGIKVIDRNTGEVCVFQYFAMVEAFVGTPFISTVDRNFHEQVVNNRTVRYDMTVTNPNQGQHRATTSLKITGVEFSGDEIDHNGSNAVFEVHGLSNISDENPLILAPGAIYTFSVSFMPKAVRSYSSQIKFIADAEIPKNTSFIEGIGIQPGLLVNGDDWGERLVDPNSYIQKGGTHDYTPYPSPNGAIVLTNDGTAPVTLRVPEIVSETRGLGFKALVNGNYVSLTAPGRLADLFENRVIRAGENYTVPVFFDPKEEGNHELTIRFISDATASPTSTLAGIGVFPKVETEDLEFDERIVGLGSERKTFTINAIEWPFDYPLTITDFTVQPSNAATTVSLYGGNGTFRWDRNNIKDKDGNNITLPVTLQPNDYIEIEVEFEPTVAGNFEATLTTVSNAEIEVVSTWTASSIEIGTTMTPATAQTCVNSPITLRPTISNNGSVEMEVLSTRLESNNPIFTIGDFTVTNPSFTLAPDGTQEIVVIFTPQRAFNNLVVDVIVEYEQPRGSGDVKEVRTTLTVTSTHTVQPTFSRVGLGNTVPNATRVEVDPGKGEAVTYTVYLNANAAVPLAESLVFEAQVKYSKDFLGVNYRNRAARELNITIGARLQGLGWNIVSSEVTAFDELTNVETVTITFAGLAPLRDNYGELELATIKFDSYLPWYKDSDGNVKIKNEPVTIEHIVLNNDPCVDYTSEYSTVALNPTCVDNLRPIQISATKYGLRPIAPNPVGSTGADVNFSVGGNNIFTEIKIYNSTSELVATIFSGTLNPGEYSARIPVENLASGMYFVEMVSGPFRSEYEKLVISK